ncbi:hypothetical protein [Flavobacterium aquicola]|uniref:Uncharacterized protein n=1 Tax=Flavobacterium aquicola TaxID=1682742 RepID=A0A3E0EL60_9FLAO|nr:hypothetical protein [Flavobacterium aquicola]REG98865.1 hypothetical protein C8P67_10524 [Flavobacterium aquicola]
MTHIQSLPADLRSVIGTENIDFSIIAKRKQPLKNSWGLIIFGTIWSAFISIFVIAFLGPLLKGEEVHFKVNDEPTTGSWENFEPLLVPTLFIGLFVIIGIAILCSGLYSFFQKGGNFVGTENRLIHYRKGTIKTYDWEQFSGNMEINSQKEDISMELRTGKMVSRKNKPDEYVPDILYISGVPNVLEIEKICRNRIKENDPIPAVTSNT